MIAVIAGRSDQYQYFLRYEVPKEEHDKYRFVNTYEKVCGWSFDGYLTYGTYYELPKVQEIIQSLERRGAKPLKGNYS